MVASTKSEVTTKCNKCLAVDEMGDCLATVDVGQKLGAVPLLGGELCPHVTKCGLDWRLPSYQGHLHPSSRSAATDKSRNLGGCAPWGALGPHLTQCCPGQGLPSYQVQFWSIQQFGHNKHGPKIGGLCPLFWGGGAGSPSSPMWPGPRPTFTHLASWSMQPFGHNRHGPKTGGCPLLGGGGTWVPI